MSCNYEQWFCQEILKSEVQFANHGSYSYSVTWWFLGIGEVALILFTVKSF